MWVRLSTVGSIGSENGEIIADEEYKNACRITLERCKKYYAITSGVYGGMVHTTFATANDYLEKYDTMKADLQAFVDTDTSLSEELDFYDKFTAKY